MIAPRRHRFLGGIVLRPSRKLTPVRIGKKESGNVGIGTR